jgi:hypothetical protein
MQCEWVIGLFEGEQAKSVLAHADMGIGYFIQKQERNGYNRTVYAAFRRPMDSPRPEHLQLCSPSQVAILEKKLRVRQGKRDDVRVSKGEQEAIGIPSGTVRKTGHSQPYSLSEIFPGGRGAID